MLGSPSAAASWSLNFRRGGSRTCPAFEVWTSSSVAPIPPRSGREKGDHQIPTLIQVQNIISSTYVEIALGIEQTNINEHIRVRVVESSRVFTRINCNEEMEVLTAVFFLDRKH